MEPRKPAADRIRPILEAMERSIDSARRKRTLGDEPPRQSADKTASADAASCEGAAGAHANPLASLPGALPQPQPQPKGGSDDPLRTETGERLKAKPKRPQNFSPPHVQPLPPYHSRAS